MIDRTSITKFAIYDSPALELFEKWQAVYAQQWVLEDDEAMAQMSEPLVKIEAQIRALRCRHLQDLFYALMAESCFGQYNIQRSPEMTWEYMQLAEKEAKERDGLATLIEQHRSAYLKWNELLGRHDSGAPEYVAEDGDKLNEQEMALLAELIEYPCSSIANVMLKGRYIAALQASGGLCFEDAEAFVRTLLEIREPEKC